MSWVSLPVQNMGTLPFMMHVSMCADLVAGTFPEMIRLPILDTRICQACDDLMDTSDIPDLTLDEYLNLPNEYQFSIESIEQKYEMIPNRRPFCVHCADEVHLLTCRKKGIPDPFQVFEHTLLYQDLEDIFELRRLLSTNFDFLDSIRFPKTNEPALFVIPGTIRKPLEICIYYVTNTSHQRRILAFIDDYFEKKPLYQRKVIFYLEEIPIRKRNLAKKEILLERAVF